MTELNRSKEIAMNTNSMQSIQPELHSTTPIVRFGFAVAALSATLSVGGLIEFLATDLTNYADAQKRPVMVAGRE